MVTDTGADEGWYSGDVHGDETIRERILAKNQTTRPKPFVFVLMPFDPAFDDVYEFGIKGAANDVGAYAERLDEQMFTEGMLDRIFNQISKADVIVADMTGRNANVFYEVGYAHALGKVTLLVTQTKDDIPFDLQQRQHTEYKGNIKLLRRELKKKLKWAITEAKRVAEGAASDERISVRILDVDLFEGPIDGEAPVVGGVVRSRYVEVPIAIRNDSQEGSVGISHAYLFADTKAVAVPGKMNPVYFNTGPGLETSIVGLGGATAVSLSSLEPSRLPSIAASPIDAPDGLGTQFRLPFSFLPMPPGASEVQSVGFILPEAATSCDDALRLRLHTPTRFYDYRFDLCLTFDDDEKE